MLFPAHAQVFEPLGTSKSNPAMRRAGTVSRVSGGRLITRGSQSGDISSGIGFARKILRV
jgi:hypothetical protein